MEQLQEAPSAQPETTALESDLASTVVPSATGLHATGDVRQVPLRAMDLEDKTFCFRLQLRVSELKRSIETDGLQMPLVLRELPSGRYQIVSGFRRVKAVQELGWESVPAFVRTDLQDAETAFGAAVLENLFRKTYLNAADFAETEGDVDGRSSAELS